MRQIIQFVQLENNNIYNMQQQQPKQMHIKTAIRVRPFSLRQKQYNPQLCIDMPDQKTTRLLNMDQLGQHRDFTSDYTFWSHDRYRVDQNDCLVYYMGLYRDRGDGQGQGETQGNSKSKKYASQRRIFQEIGMEMLDNAWLGYNCCIFAYGQTGAGKTYTMLGHESNKGITLNSCEQIFRRISADKNKNKEYQVNISMIEIYNEKIQDLLVPINKRQKFGYKIRQHKTMGIYIENLSRYCVQNYEQIQYKIDEGIKNRMLAYTHLSSTSTRSHVVITIQLKQTQLIENCRRQKKSVIHFVDLAGSQKIKKTSATGDRLKQASCIGKSLSALGLVISILAQNSIRNQIQTQENLAKKKKFVPYRDSCLTRILQTALGGNCKTYMIVLVSPASMNYQQTLSSLRYANSTRKIINKPVINQTIKTVQDIEQQKNQIFKEVQEKVEICQKQLTETNENGQKKEQITISLSFLNKSQDNSRQTERPIQSNCVQKQQKIKIQIQVNQKQQIQQVKIEQQNQQV